jgi:hypothetical protein
LPLRPPLPAAILEVADQFLLFGVDGYDRLLRVQRDRDRIIDVAKLGIPIRVRIAFARFAIGLQAEVQLMQQFANHRPADLMALRAQFGGEPTQALAGPAQRRLGIAALGRLNQNQQSLQQLRIAFHQRLAAAAAAANLSRGQLLVPGQLVQPTTDRAGRNPGRARHRRDPTIAGSPGLRRRKNAPTSFV